jgi:hypothetical protein
MEKLETLLTIDGSVNCYNLYGKLKIKVQISYFDVVLPLSI